MGNVCLPKQCQPLVCQHRLPASASPMTPISTDFNQPKNVCQICSSQQKYKVKCEQGVAGVQGMPGDAGVRGEKGVVEICGQKIEGISTQNRQRQLVISKSRKTSINDFEVLRGLGKGGFGKVYLIKQRTHNRPPLQLAIVDIHDEQQSTGEKDEQPQQLQVEQASSQQAFQEDQSKHSSNEPSRTSQKEGRKSQKEARTSQKEARTSQKEATRKRAEQRLFQLKGQGVRYYALKIINKSRLKSSRERQQALAQRLILECLDHPFIIKLHYAFQSESRLFLIVDLLQGGELFYLLRKAQRFQEEVAKFYAAEILLALEYLHRNNIIYRDLKPENVLLDSQAHIKITDFGLSKMLYSTTQNTYSFCGTPEYLAPQIISGKGYNKAADWFSFGCLLYDMLTGSPPFQSKHKREILNKLPTKPIYLPHFLSPNAKSLLGGLFKVQPSQRLGFSKGATEIMSHSFFQGVDFAKIYRKEVTPPFTFNTDMVSHDKHQLFINSNGFESWNSWQINVNSPKRSKKNEQNQIKFQGFTYGADQFQLEGFILQKTEE